MPPMRVVFIEYWFSANAVLRRPRLGVHCRYSSFSRLLVLPALVGLPAALAAVGLRLGVR